MPRGHTFVELTAVLLLLALSTAALAAPARRYRDRAAVVAAREALAGLVADARIMAMGHGFASVHLADAPWRAWSAVGDSVARTLELEEELGVRVVLSRRRVTAEIAFDALGLGRVASETVGLERGRERAELIVSSYGRVRRR